MCSQQRSPIVFAAEVAARRRPTEGGPSTSLSWALVGCARSRSDACRSEGRHKGSASTGGFGERIVEMRFRTRKGPKYQGQGVCSFCGKNKSQVEKLVAGPGVYICDECIRMCAEVLEEERAPR